MSNQQDRVALLITATICGVLFVIVLDLAISSELHTATERATNLAALGAIGLALAVGISKWFNHQHDDGDDDPNVEQ